jgi:hypothetical protein
MPREGPKCLHARHGVVTFLRHQLQHDVVPAQRPHHCGRGL